MTRRVGLLAVLLMIVAPVVADETFPGRKLYPAIPYIELTDLYKRLNNVVIVDVRSAYEYETLRISGAINIPFSSAKFVGSMKMLRAENPTKPIVVYCNGKTCMKSYTAVTKCRAHKIPNVIAYDAGIMDWAAKYPKNAMLLGKVLNNPARLISKAEFKKHLLSTTDFEAKATSGRTLVLDMRDRFQREAIGIFVGFEQSVYFDDTKTLDAFISRSKREQKALLIYDAVGKQVRWLQYYLEETGLKDYYFMDGGAEAYFAGLRKQYVQ